MWLVLLVLVVAGVRGMNEMCTKLMVWNGMDTVSSFFGSIGVARWVALGNPTAMETKIPFPTH